MKVWAAAMVSGVILGGLLTAGTAAARTEEEPTVAPPAETAQAAPVLQTAQTAQTAGSDPDAQVSWVVSQFHDVPQDAYYASALAWAVNQQVVAIPQERCFDPNGVCTRGQVAAMLWQGVGAPEPTGTNPFSDVPAGAYYEKAVTGAYEAGLLSGTTFRGDDLCSRGDAITMLWKLMGRPGLDQDEAPWYLLLANPWNAIPQGYSISLAAVDGGSYQMDQRCVDALNQMLAACRQAGNSPAVCSAYRTQATQERLYRNEVNKLIALGWSRAKAEEIAGRSTAVPGTSEHQIGLAADLVDAHYWKLNEKQATMPAQKWLMEHSWEYGFILRYPSNKTELTGIKYEPWHYRYVGVEAAKVIYEQGLCLEEYVAQMAEYRPAVSWAKARGVTASADVSSFAPYDTCTRAQLITFLHEALT